VLSSKSWFTLSILIVNFVSPTFILIRFDVKKFSTAEDLIPKLRPSVISFAIPDTAIATNSPFSLTIGPPLFPGFIGISCWISFELLSNPLSALIFPSLIFKSSLKNFPNGYPAAVMGWRFLGASFENEIYDLGLISAFNSARSRVLSVAINSVSYSLL